MNELNSDSIESIDKAGMLGEVLAQPLQLGDALWRAESAGIRPRDLPGGLVVCGMGGSAIGGDLALAALGDPVIGVPAGMQPRAAVVYMTIGALECAALCGAAPALHAEVDTATALLETLVEEWGPGAAEDSLAKQVARDLVGTIPVIHGAASTVAVGRRWSTQINENADSPAFWAELPEANHNQICGWERGRAEAPFAGVFLSDPDQHPRVQRRIDLMAAEVERTGAPAIKLESRGESRLERVLSHVLLADMVSVYLAVLNGVDPTPVDAIDRFKASL